MIGRSDDTVCNSHRTHRGDEKHRFPGLASKLVATVSQSFGFKTTATGSWFGPQNQDRLFGDLGLKIIVMVYWFGPQNHVGRDLSVCASKLIGG
jgi:hypothetical protein